MQNPPVNAPVPPAPNAAAAADPVLVPQFVERYQQKQAFRRGQILEEYYRNGYTYSEHTKKFLNFLTAGAQPGESDASILCNQLMLYEVAETVPHGFAKHWFIALCPKKSRRLVVASRFVTNAYNKEGIQKFSHPSNLPMGSKLSPGYGPCVLDCFFCEEKKTYYVLDLIIWDGHVYYDQITEVRMKELINKLHDYDLVKESPNNPYPFLPIKVFAPTKSNLIGSATLAPFEISGLLFFHRLTFYSPGETPLVVNLKREHLGILNIPIPGIVDQVYRWPRSVPPGVLARPGQRRRRMPMAVATRNQVPKGRNREEFFPIHFAYDPSTDRNANQQAADGAGADGAANNATDDNNGQNGQAPMDQNNNSSVNVASFVDNLDIQQERVEDSVFLQPKTITEVKIQKCVTNNSNACSAHPGPRMETVDKKIPGSSLCWM